MMIQKFTTLDDFKLHAKSLNVPIRKLPAHCEDPGNHYFIGTDEAFNYFDSTGGYLQRNSGYFYNCGSESYGEIDA